MQKHIVSLPVPVDVALHPHNLFLAAWLYGGIFGLAGFIGILWGVAKKIKVGLRSDDRAFYLAVAAFFAVTLAHGLVDTTYWKNDLALLWWILVALL